MVEGEGSRLVTHVEGQNVPEVGEEVSFVQPPVQPSIQLAENVPNQPGIPQGDQTVYEYECEFNRLSRFTSELIPTERERTACFIEGLDVDYKEVLVAMDIVFG
ncbi:hypothetical protein V6N13_123391 [Hibiscus sabdariffa]